MAETTTDEWGVTTTIISPDEVIRQREIAALLRPDHLCSGSGSVGTRADGSMVMTHRPCPGCVAKRERIGSQYPDLFPQRVASAKRFSAQELLSKIEQSGYWPGNVEWLDFLRSIAGVQHG